MRRALIKRGFEHPLSICSIMLANAGTMTIGCYLSSLNFSISRF